jgi:hypothetical protein
LRTTETDQRAIFASPGRRRLVAVRLLGGLLFTLGVLWLASLALGAIGFLQLPLVSSGETSPRPKLDRSEQLRLPAVRSGDGRTSSP